MKKKPWQNNNYMYSKILGLLNFCMFLISGVAAIYLINVIQDVMAGMMAAIFCIIAMVYFDSQNRHQSQELDEIKHSWYLEQIYKKVKRLKK